MLKKIQLLFAIALAFPAASYGLVGGPFDTGDYSQQLDEAGIYQASLRFSNGQGFCQFGSNVDITNYIDQSQSGGGAGGQNATLRSATYSYLNRSVIYYKGMTYLGQCWGMVDMSRKSIEGYTNGNSDVSTTTATGGNSTQNQLQTISSVNTLIANGQRAFTCNTAWRAKIQPYAPVLKFRGEGELTVLNPDGTNQVQALLDDLATGISDAATDDNVTAAEFQSILGRVQTMILGGSITTAPTNAVPLADLFAAATATSNSVFDAADRVPMRVFGMRKFFLTRR